MSEKKLVETYRLGQRIGRAFRRGIKDFRLIVPGDRVLVGLSGGKDSLALLELLGDMARHTNRSFTVKALHVRMGNVDYHSDTAYLEAFAQRCGAELTVRETSFEADRDVKRSPCFLCSWNRRKVFFETAQELGCNKIALGHHQDDILRTALMNLTFEGSFATMPVLLKMKKFPITLIRPLCRVREDDLRQWAKARAYEPLLKVCPYDRASNRTNIERVFAAMENLSKEARYSLWHALQRDGKLVEL